MRNDWVNYVGPERLVDGAFLITIVDGVLDPECWPVDAIIIKSGVVIRQCEAYRSDHTTIYKTQDFVGMDEGELRTFINDCNDGSDNPEHSCFLLKEV